MDVKRPILLDVYPQYSTDDLPAEREAEGRFSTTFHFINRGLFAFGEGCTAVVDLPPMHPNGAIKTSRYCCYEGEPHWAALMHLDIEHLRGAERLARATPPLAHGVFDVYRVDHDLVYIKEPCAMEDVRPRFFLHAFLQHSDTGWITGLDFEFNEHGGFVDGRCVIVRALPNDDLARIRTGQFVAGEGRVWTAEFPVAHAPESGQPMPHRASSVGVDEGA